MKVLPACVGLLALALLATAVDARACSCVPPDPWTYIQESDAAFVGRLVERRDASGGAAILTFSVERSVKGKLGSRVEVRTPSSGASCGIEAPIGERVGLFLMRERGAWIGSLCKQVSPDDLLAAAKPLPAPNGRGAPAMWVGGRFGPARVMALDAHGRTLAYGRGKGVTRHLSVCPGARRVAELAFESGLEGIVRLAVRDARTLSVVRRRAVRLPGGRNPAALLCENATGSSVVVFGLPRGERGSGLYRIGSGPAREIWRGSGFLSSLVEGTAYVNAGWPKGKRLVEVDLRTGRVQDIATVPRKPRLAPNEKRTRLAGIAVRDNYRSRLVLVDVGKPASVRWIVLDDRNVDGDVHFLSNGRLLYLPTAFDETARVLDASLRTLRRFEWRARDSALAGSRAFGITFTGELISARVGRGAARVVRRLPGSADPEVIVAAQP